MDSEMNRGFLGRRWRVFAHHKAQRLDQVVGTRARVETRLVRIRIATA